MQFILFFPIQAEEEEEEDEVETGNPKKKLKLSVDSEKNNKTQSINNKKSKWIEITQDYWIKNEEEKTKSKWNTF